MKIMTHVEPERTSGRTCCDTNDIPTLEQWLYDKKITENLYTKLTSQNPQYTIDMLLFMNENDIKQLKNDINGIKMNEIFQLISLISKINTSRIYRDINKNKPVIYLTPKQHNTINKLKQNLADISTKLDEISDISKNITRECDSNVLLICNTFDEMIEILRKQKLKMVNKIYSIYQNKDEKIKIARNKLQQLYSKSLNLKNKFESFTGSIQMSSISSNEKIIYKENEMDLIVKKNDQQINETFELFNLLSSELGGPISSKSTKTRIGVDVCEKKEMEQIASRLVKINHDTTLTSIKNKGVAKTAQKVSQNVVSNFSFIDHTCCNRKLTLSNGNHSVESFDGCVIQVYYGSDSIPLGKSTFTMTVDKRNSIGVIGIGFVPLSLGGSIDSVTVHNNKHSWMLFCNGQLYSKSIASQTNITFSSLNDKMSIFTNFKQGKDSSKVLIVNEKTKQKIAIENLSYPLRLIFYVFYAKITVT